MVVIATKLSPIQQGFYFTFSSLLALQMFFDLGLMFVIAQFSSHEFVDLSWKKNGAIDGSPLAVRRFTDLLCKTTLWFGVAALLMIIVLVPAGLIFFQQKGNVDFSWRIPWTLAVIGTALNLFVCPFFSIMLGSGEVVTVNKRELVSALSSSILCWSVLSLHGGLYAAFAVNLGGLFISWGYLLSRRPEMIKLAWRGWFGEERQQRKASGGLSWWKEIWPMQWRLAISVGSSYFIFQLFNPVLFQYHGSVIAGQMGMTLTAANALLAGSTTVFNVKVPEFGKLVANRDWKRLDDIFMDGTRRALLLALFGTVAGTSAIWALQSYTTLGKRFIPYAEAGLLFSTVFFQIVIASLAAYLRSHKKEPLMKMTILASILQGAATWYFGKHYAALGVTVAFFIINSCFIFPYTFFVWRRCKRQWHSAEAPEPLQPGTEPL
ncbi:hypothetical protein [Geomonas sp.]|uniref:hypothetical protein n=1 Tax=Geomonas sp. TaxID=2651584 RepID=UPI002B479D41|nr:hypothetical protein [Geomonas sp.]